MIRVYNTLSGVKEVFQPVRSGYASIYVCGVTPYDRAHVGHARPAVIWDAFKRFLWRRGYIVRHVQNFTDIDDKLIARAQHLKMAVGDLADIHIRDYLSALRRLDVIPPDFLPRVTDNIPQIIHFIEALLSKGFAYAAGGDVYFAVDQKPDYGKLSHRCVDDLLEGVRIEVQENKRAPQDFALWKASRTQEPGWDSPWGRGRPGWHIECSAMASTYVGPQFDFHGGGIDLVFPHHENEIAQSEAYFGHGSANIWMHNGLVTLESVKMSKSLGNGADLGQLLVRFDPLVIRTFLLSAHYRTPLDFSEAALAEWEKAIRRLRGLYDAVQAAEPPSVWLSPPASDPLIQFEERFLAALDDDFNTARALAEVFEMVHAVYRGMAAGGAMEAAARFWGRQNLERADAILRFLPASPVRPLGDERGLVEEMMALRQAARAQREYAWADSLRDAMARAGWEIEDTKTGSEVHWRPREKGNHATTT